MKPVFLFDASAVSHFYTPNKKYQDVIAHLTALRLSKEAFFFIPSFCVAETLNVFAKMHYRQGLIKKDTHDQIRNSFVKAVHDRKFFYSYDLNRYHNLNAEGIFPIEHTTNTEFVYADGQKPKGKTVQEREMSLNGIIRDLLDRKIPVHRHYLSTLDMLIIAMAQELRRFSGEKRTFIVTDDERINTICVKGKAFNKVIFLRTVGLPDLKARLNPKSA